MELSGRDEWDGKYLGQGHGVQAEWSVSVTEIL